MRCVICGGPIIRTVDWELSDSGKPEFMPVIKCLMCGRDPGPRPEAPAPFVPSERTLRERQGNLDAVRKFKGARV